MVKLQYHDKIIIVDKNYKNRLFLLLIIKL